jgi:hypothetical protein
MTTEPAPAIPVALQNPLDDNALLDRLKETFGIEHDADVARMIGCARQALSDIRSPNSSRKLTPYQKLCIYDRLGYAWARDALIALFPEKTSAAMRRWDNERTLKNLD